MGGVAYDIDPQLKLELSYRYLNSGPFTIPGGGMISTVKSNMESHQVKLGFRYMID
jgi:opacity protein-like surface antigen